MKVSKTKSLLSSSVLLIAMSGAVIPPNYDYQAQAQTASAEEISKSTSYDGRRRVEVQGKPSLTTTRNLRSEI